MPPRQILFIARLAAWAALAPCALAAIMLALLESSEFARPTGELLISYLKLYFAYAALYAASVVALASRSSLSSRLLAAMGAAACVIAGGALAYIGGFALGIMLLLPTAFLGLGAAGPLLAIPIAGAGIGELITRLLSALVGWPRKGAEIAQVRFAHVAAAAAAAALAFYFGMGLSSGAMPSFGLERIAVMVGMGVAGPLTLVALLSLPLPKQEAIGERTSLERPAWRAFAAVMLVAAVILNIQGRQIDTKTGHKLWTAQGLADTLASHSAIVERRKPPADQPVRMENYVIGLRPADLQENYYDWRTGRFISAEFKLGNAGSTDRPVEVRAALSASRETGLGYRCDPPADGKLAPCSVVGREAAKDPRILHVGLYQGQSQIGRQGWTFMISCRYSGGFCKIEFTEPWFNGVRVAVIYTPQDVDRWIDVVPFSISQLEALVRPAP